MTGLNLEGASISVAPPGTPPGEGIPWENIGHAIAAELDFSEETTVGTPHDTRSMMDLIKEATVTIEPGWSRSAVNAILGGADLGGIRIVEHDYVPARSMWYEVAGYPTIYVPSARMRPMNNLEREGEWAKRTVRHGLTAALPWLRMDPGPHPDDVWTDELWVAEVAPAPSSSWWAGDLT